MVVHFVVEKWHPKAVDDIRSLRLDLVSSACWAEAIEGFVWSCVEEQILEWSGWACAVSQQANRLVGAKYPSVCEDIKNRTSVCDEGYSGVCYLWGNAMSEHLRYVRVVGACSGEGVLSTYC
jgi:hypothetical protein